MKVRQPVDPAAAQAAWADTLAAAGLGRVLVGADAFQRKYLVGSGGELHGLSSVHGRAVGPECPPASVAQRAC